MSVGQPLPKKVMSTGPAKPDSEIIRRSEIADHVAELIGPIRNLAESADLTYLTYLLDMAREEALQMRDKLKIRK